MAVPDTRFRMSIAEVLQRLADHFRWNPPNRRDPARAAHVLRTELDLSPTAFPDAYLLYAMTEAAPHLLGPPRHFLWELAHPSQPGVWIPMSTPTLPKFMDPHRARNVVPLYPVEPNEPTTSRRNG